jgi:pimeloyl-ACP methyl ester carboxylesterase
MKNATKLQNSFKIFCEKKGKGKPNYVFIHGTGGDHTQFVSQMDYFSQKGTTLTFDLRGHGKSEKTATKYTIECFADDIQRILLSQEIIKPILVGFSMGGNIAIELASRHPNLAKALVLLDSSFLYTTKTQELMQSYYENIQKDFKKTIAEIVNQSCLPHDKYKPKITKALLSTPQSVWASALKGMLEWDTLAAEKLKKCTLPILYIEATHQVVDMNRFKDLCPQLVHGKTVGSGHFISMEVPEQVNSMIEHFQKIYL